MMNLPTKFLPRSWIFEKKYDCQNKMANLFQIISREYFRRVLLKFQREWGLRIIWVKLFKKLYWHNFYKSHFSLQKCLNCHKNYGIPLKSKMRRIKIKKKRLSINHIENIPLEYFWFYQFGPRLNFK